MNNYYFYEIKSELSFESLISKNTSMKRACLNKTSKLMIVLACGVPYDLNLKNKK